MAKKKAKVVSVYMGGSEQWSFEPMEERENAFITPRFARMPPMEVGAELKVGKDRIGIVTAHGSYQGTSMLISYDPSTSKREVPRKRRKARRPAPVEVEVKTEKVEEAEDGLGSSGVGSS
jgi:hypothetical protein